MTKPSASPVDPVPPSAYPAFSPVTSSAPEMPDVWSATVLLHPFSPPFSRDPRPNSPFFQLCTATLDYFRDQYFSARVTGCDYGQWWYTVTPSGTHLSTDGGIKWVKRDMGWSLPTDWYGAKAPTARCPGAAPMNWMSEQLMEWWTIEAPITPVPPPLKGQPVPLTTNPPPVAATWLWFDAASKAPQRMMFGNGPPKPHQGDPTQLAFLQMFSFSYFASFTEIDAAAAPPRPALWEAPSIPGFTPGNPHGYLPFVWNTNFGMTAFMTPVNGRYNPLPTRVLYKWTPDWKYQTNTDRAQDTLMQYNYNLHQPANQKPIKYQTALLFGPAPVGMPPPANSGRGFLISDYDDGSSDCKTGKAFPFPQEPPNWVSMPGVEGTIQATIVNNPVLGPGHVVTVCSVLFPPAKPNYPEATYLWTWYAPKLGGNGTASRPITFMQSQSGVGAGTSLALADYYYYQEFKTPIDAENFVIPSCCS